MRRGATVSIYLLLAGVVLLFLGCNGPGPDGAERERIVVFAAASLTDALEVLADSFEVAYPGYRVVLNVAATSLLARQIEQGAPADLFFSANQTWMEHIQKKDQLVGPIYYPVTNQLVVIVRDTTSVSSLESFNQVQRLALADPDHVPAGIYAKRGLECTGQWGAMVPRVIPTMDVRAALLAVRNGAAEAAMVYTSDAHLDKSIQVAFTWPEACQPEIQYAVARLKKAPNPTGSQQLIDYVVDPERKQLWEQFGFVPLIVPESSSSP